MLMDNDHFARGIAERKLTVRYVGVSDVNVKSSCPAVVVEPLLSHPCSYLAYVVVDGVPPRWGSLGKGDPPISLGVEVSTKFLCHHCCC